MSVQAELANLMQDGVTIYTRSSFDSYGEPTWSAGSTYASRNVFAEERQVNALGQEEIFIATCWVNASTTFPVGVRVVTDDGTTGYVKESRSYPDETGAIHHARLKLGPA